MISLLVEGGCVKRWLPYVLVVLGLAGLLSGWLLYPGSGCSISAIYGEYVQGTGELTNGYACTEGTFELYASLVLLLSGGLAFLGGWFWAVPRHASRITTRARPHFLAGCVLLAVALVGTGGWFGWQKYDDHRDNQRLQQAERDLAALQLPAEWSPVNHLNRCTDGGLGRCAHVDGKPGDVMAQLIDLLHGKDQTRPCPPTRRVPCDVEIRGEIAGYPAYAYAQPDIYFESEKPPPGAKPFYMTPASKKPIYVVGSVIQIYLLTPEG